MNGIDWLAKFNDACDRVDLGAIENLVDIQLRQKTSGVTHTTYLDQWIRVARCFGYATHDGSWGEFEKEFAIIISSLVLYRRIAELAEIVADQDEGKFLRPLLTPKGEVYECIWCHGTTAIDVPDDYIPSEHLEWHGESCVIRQICELSGRK